MPLNRPSKQELLTAVTEYLQQKPLEAKADLFFRRVAANVLGIVQREEQQAEQFQQLEIEMLQQFLASNESDPALLNQTLAQAIDNGDVAINSALTHMLLRLADAKLSIDNPKYKI